MWKNFKCFMHDIARGAYVKPEYFEKIITYAADSGYTHYLPYLENMIRLPSIQNACPNSAYTPTQWKNFDAHAKNLGIELIPHFSLAGHSSAICRAYPSLAGEDSTELDINKQEVKEWSLRCLDEFCSFSTAKYFLIGGDEWQSPNNLLATPEFNQGKAYAEYFNPAIELLVKKGRIPIVWHDMFIHFPEALERLSKKAVIAFWFYDVDSDHPILDMFKQKGFNCIMASGLCSAMLTRRRVNAIKNAVKVCDKYDPSGIMITSWTDGRFEKIKLNLELTGKLLAGDKIPNKIPESISLQEIGNCYSILPSFSSKLENELKKSLNSDAWNQYPLYRKYLENQVFKKRNSELESYLKYHFPEGNLYYSILKQGKSFQYINKTNAVSNERFYFSESQKSLGNVINIVNGDESFKLYPSFGGSLQDYQKGGTEIIPNTIPRFLQKNNFLPGGYRSYTGVGGLRPIWAFGSHHVPCILWQDKFEYNISKKDDIIIINLSKKLYHVEVNYSIEVRKGHSGFIYQCQALNKIDNTYGTFSFNLPLKLNERKFHETCIIPDNLKEIQLIKQRDIFFVIPASKKLIIRDGEIDFNIDICNGESAGFYVNLHPNMITPDLRGKYRRMNKNDQYKCSWKFSTNLLS
jgi:hypothetical protein